MSDKILINKQAVFSDGTRNFRVPSECDSGDTVTVYIRTASSNVSEVRFCRNDHDSAIMTPDRTDELFDYFKFSLTVGDEPVSYYFELVSGDGSDRCIYDAEGAKDFPAECVRTFEIIPGAHTPDWAKGRVFYQIFVDRFANGDKTNDVLPGEYAYIEGMQANREGVHDVAVFHGGDLKGIIDKLDYLSKLGVGGIYLSPVFVSPSSHKYDIMDYDAVDPHYGRIVVDEGDLLEEGDTDNGHASRFICRVTHPDNIKASNDLLAELIEEAHKLDIRVILDGVFNHCGSFHKWMDREGIYAGADGFEPGAWQNTDSPYRSYFRFNDNYASELNAWRAIHGDDADEADKPHPYEGWWNYETLPKLNYDEYPELSQAVRDIARKWLMPPFDADGWRLDVAADLGHGEDFNHAFWREFRKAVKSVDPEKLILAEHYGSFADRLRGDEWDGIMNYDAFMEPVGWFLTGMDKHSDYKNDELLGNADAFFSEMMGGLNSIQASAAGVMMNEISNHDHSRFMTRTNGVCGRVENLGKAAADDGCDPAVYMQGVVIQMTWPGMPTLYYGDEVGLRGFTDPDNRRPFPWGNEDLELLEFHKYIIAMHNRIESLNAGSVMPLVSETGIAAYGRFMAGEGAGSAAAVVINRFGDSRMILPVWKLGIKDGTVMERIMQTGPSGYNVGRVSQTVKDGCICLEAGERTSSVWVPVK